MTWYARDGGSWRTIVRPQARVSGAWQPIRNAWVRVSGTWQLFFTNLSATASPDSVSGSNIITAPDNCPVTTNSTTVTPTGGSAPYTYSWAMVSGTTATINSPTSATTTFSRDVFLDNPGQSLTRTGVARCTVTDANLQTTTVDVTVETIHNAV